jgi:NAD-dependent dihydropyrimidine dehydrogenase PreA subunit
MIFIDEDKCTGCGDCLEVCPEEGAIVLQEEKAIINRELCTNCAACMPACSEGAIYEVEAAPVAAEREQPAQVTKQPAVSRARPAIVSTLVAAAPLAVDAVVGLARRWLEGRSVARRTGGQAEPGRGDQAGPGAGGRRRRQRGRGRR